MIGCIWVLFFILLSTQEESTLQMISPGLTREMGNKAKEGGGAQKLPEVPLADLRRMLQEVIGGSVIVTLHVDNGLLVWPCY